MQEEEEDGDLGARRFLFYRPVSLYRPCDLKAKKLMGADFVKTKPVPIHTEDKEAAQKENQLFFFL